MSRRLFFAVPLPSETRKRIQQEIYPKLTLFQHGLKIVPSQNLHLTLRFLGETPKEKAAGIKEKLGELEQQSAFEIALKEIGSFHERILWIGIEKGKQELEKLAGIVSQKLGLEQEPFSAHLTIARNKNLSGNEWKKMVQQLEQESFEARFAAESVHLIQSNLKPSGSEYQIFCEWKLKSH